MLQESVEGLVVPLAFQPFGVDVAHSPTLHFVAHVEGKQVSTLEFESVTDGDALITLEVPLGDSVGFWNANSRFHRTVLLDWMGQQVTSLVDSVPAGCVYDNAGSAVLSFALGECVREVSMRYGVWEWGDSFVVHLRVPNARIGQRLLLALAAPQVSYGAALDHLQTWMIAQVGRAAMPAPDYARDPVYSTWYSFGREISAALVEREAAAAHEFGIDVVFIDDGWQALATKPSYSGCGDWVPDERTFPDLGEHILRLHATGSRVVLWVAPLLLGPNSAAFASLVHLAPAHKKGLEANVFDPRLPEARAHLVRVCVDLVNEYGVDGLKIDFLDDAMVYEGTPNLGDVADVGAAMQLWLTDLLTALAAIGRPDLLIEFRQPYVSPAIASFANVLRAIDCPGDAISNRTSIVDSRLLSAERIVHADPIMWDPRASSDAVARQILNAFFAVPQFSIELDSLPDAHRRVIRFLLSEWLRLRDCILDGALSAGLPVDHYPTVRTSTSSTSVIGVYQDLVVQLGEMNDEIVILNATPSPRLVIELEPDAPRLVIELEPDAPRLTARVFQPDGTPMGSFQSNGTALWSLAIPPYGIARLTRF